MLHAGTIRQRGRRNNGHRALGLACFRLGVAALLVLALARMACAGEDGRGNAEQQWPPGIAVVYVGYSGRGGRARVFWQQLGGSREVRLIYEARSAHARVPRGFGVLPSPDGRWLHVWETVYGATGARRRTEWLAVELTSGRKLLIGEQPGEVGYFPSWLDEHRLMLERGDKTTVFDVATGRLTKPLPAGPKSVHGDQPRDIDVGWLSDAKGRSAPWREQYVRHHYPESLACALAALTQLKEELGVASYLTRRRPEAADARGGAGPAPHRTPVAPDSPEDLLVRPMGIVDWFAPGLSKGIWPGLAVSRDGRLLARTAFVPTGRKTGSDLYGNRFLGYTFDARIDVFRLPSGEHVWGKSETQRRPQLDAAAMYFSHPGLAYVLDPWFRDPRWSTDGRYLSFATVAEPAREEAVSVVDSSTWEVVLHIPNATNAFVIPVAE